MKMLLQIVTPHYCAGITVNDGVIVDAAPILRWSIGKRLKELRNYYDRKKIDIDIEIVGEST